MATTKRKLLVWQHSKTAQTCFHPVHQMFVFEALSFRKVPQMFYSLYCIDSYKIRSKGRIGMKILKICHALNFTIDNAQMDFARLYK